MISDSESPDLFLRRLTGGIAAGLALVLVGYALYLWEIRIPAIEKAVIDFNAPIPAVTRLVFNVPMIPLTLALATMLLGLAASIAPKRSTLVAAWIGALASLAATAGVELALASPLTQLVNSVSGGS